MKQCWTASWSPWKAVIVGLVLSVTPVGCGGVHLTPVTGTVKTNGQAVTGGTILFAPIASSDPNDASMATGAIQPDGTYSLKTTIGSGVAIGKYKVSYIAPDAVPKDDKSTNPKMIPSEYAALMPKTAEVEIKDGPNVIDIDLVTDPNYNPAAKAKHKGTGGR
jgi:hypothetical protein